MNVVFDSDHILWPLIEASESTAKSVWGGAIGLPRRNEKCKLFCVIFDRSDCPFRQLIVECHFRRFDGRAIYASRARRRSRKIFAGWAGVRAIFGHVLPGFAKIIRKLMRGMCNFRSRPLLGFVGRKIVPCSACGGLTEERTTLSSSMRFVGMVRPRSWAARIGDGRTIRLGGRGCGQGALGEHGVFVGRPGGSDDHSLVLGDLRFHGRCSRRR